MLTNNKHKKAFHSFLFIFPSIVGVAFFSIIPIAYSIYISLSNSKGSTISIENYVKLLNDDVYITTLLNSLKFVSIIVPIILVSSIFISALLFQMQNNKLRNVLISIFYLPCITSPVAYSLFFKQLAYSDGLLSNIIKSITNSDEAFNILQNELGAKIYISLICVWAWSGFYIIILFSAMENIDPNIYIAAKLDGAKAIRIFRIIILPIVRPVLILITLLAVCSTFQLYVEISLLTKGGPGVSTYTLSYYLYRKTFTYVADYGYSSAIGVSILLINAFFSIIVLKIRQGKE